jgi:excisionase family DNA binding protein
MLIDAKAAGELLGVPSSWVLEEARHDRIPHIRLGRYVRFDAEQLLNWARNRSRGPTYHHQQQSNGGPGAAVTARGPTPNR